MKEQKPIFANQWKGTHFKNFRYESEKQISVANRLWREEQKPIFAKLGKGIYYQNTQYESEKQIFVADRLWREEQKPISQNKEKEFTIRILNMVLYLDSLNPLQDFFAIMYI